MRRYCTGWANKSRKNGLIWKRKRSSSIKTMYGYTSVQFRWPKLWNSNLNYYKIYRICQIWSPMTFFISKLEKWLGEHQFISNKEVIAQTDACFEDLPKSYFLDGLKKLEKRFGTCIELKLFYYV